MLQALADERAEHRGGHRDLAALPDRERRVAQQRSEHRPVEQLQARVAQQVALRLTGHHERREARRDHRREPAHGHSSLERGDPRGRPDDGGAEQPARDDRRDRRRVREAQLGHPQQ
ncbi:hypothetical protein [Conexibacter sp. W3-3-2]|uniref:hypothetical protein n=1 Tax=Conexibacter sp. W3-3-2 TaxID=2675227 RepID=UPI0018A8C2EE|nr:hypothetical protein [Conexibacter sp. W3-3-2]